ncbi:uncharacterized protein LOC144443271 isoform X2 [Glandiceps talaboti]
MMEDPAFTARQQDDEAGPQLMSLGQRCKVTEQIITTTTSTPIHSYYMGAMKELSGPDVSEISAASESDRISSCMSGVEELAARVVQPSIASSSVQLEKDSADLSSKSSRHSRRSKGLTESFVSPEDLRLHIEIFETDDEYLDGEFSDDDAEYEPSFNITLIGDELQIHPTLDDGDDSDNDNSDNDNSDNDDESEECPEMDDPEECQVPGFQRIRSEEDQEHLLNDTACLVYLQQLLVLANCKISTICTSKECNGKLSVSSQFVGSALYLKWTCPAGHLEYKWCSQPVLNSRLHSGDLMTAAAILLSGNNYAKIDRFAKVLSLKLLCQTTFNRIQRTCLVPCIDKFWKEHQLQLCASFEGERLVLLGDGRMDSPGYCAQYCTYTFMENVTKKILSILTKDKRATDRKSTVLEKACFQESIDQLEEKRVDMKEVVTDAHIQIASVMKNDYPDVKHSHDIWHAAKNMTKKIVKAGQKKNCKVLLKWANSIVNHFWYCCQKATTYDEFLDMWCGVLHHVVDEHSWIVPYASNGMAQCDHGPLPEREDDREYLTKDSAAHIALRHIVFDKSFLKRVPYFLNNRSTADLESFHQLILMYASKRFAYSPPVYRVRNILAALDHNVHRARDAQQRQDGRIGYHRGYNKKSSTWSTKTVKEQKTYPHYTALKKSILQTRLEEKRGMQHKRELEPTDPRRISTHLAPVTPPPTSLLVEQHVSRYH